MAKESGKSPFFNGTYIIKRGSFSSHASLPEGIYIYIRIYIYTYIYVYICILFLIVTVLANEPLYIYPGSLGRPWNFNGPEPESPPLFWRFGIYFINNSKVDYDFNGLCLTCRGYSWISCNRFSRIITALKKLIDQDINLLLFKLIPCHISQILLWFPFVRMGFIWNTPPKTNMDNDPKWWFGNGDSF